MTTLNEAEVEQGTLDWQVIYGSDIHPDKPSAERVGYGQVTDHI